MNKPRRRCSKLDILSVMQEGVCRQEAADRLGISHETLARYLKAFEIHWPRRPKKARVERAVLQAIAEGHVTARALAQKFGLSRPRMSVELTHMADKNLIRRGPSRRAGGTGRPCIEWRIVAPTAPVMARHEARA
jgi:predicted ArsR family transcriptional regulator